MAARSHARALREGIIIGSALRDPCSVKLNCGNTAEFRVMTVRDNG